MSDLILNLSYSEDLILPLVNDQDEVVNLLIFLSYIRKE